MPTFLYHFTHIDNLVGILEDGGLHSDSALGERQETPVNIAYKGIKQRRAATTVKNRGQGGYVADYVPFYFATKSPMLYTIAKGNVSQFAGNQTELIYLVSTVEQIAQESNSWCFSDKHPINSLAKFYDDLSDLGQVDWEIMKEQVWRNTPEDQQRKSRRQAEFLVHSFVPWQWIKAIGVANTDMARRVREAPTLLPLDRNVDNIPELPIIVLRPSWYHLNIG